MGSGLPRHIHANAHDWGQVLMVEGKIGQAFRSFTISYGENRDVDFDTFFEAAHHFLFSTRLRPLTIEEKLSQMCQQTVDSESAKTKRGEAGTWSSPARNTFLGRLA